MAQSDPEISAGGDQTYFLGSLHLAVFPGAIILLGMAPRITQYLHYRALFHDEAVLANNVVGRPVAELFGPFGDSMAPGGYLLLTRGAIALGGVNEYAARFVPFLSGLLALCLFYSVASRTSHHELNKAIDYAEAHWQEGDKLYIQFLSSSPISFLRWRHDLEDEDFIIEPRFMEGDEEAAFMDEQYSALQEHRRVWVPITFDFPSQIDEYLEPWDARATRVEESHSLGAVVVLYLLR